MTVRRDDEQGWRFDRRISVDTLVGIAGVALVIGGPLFYWARNMEDRVQRLEVVQVESEKNDSARAQDDHDSRKAIADRLEKIEGKVTELQITVGRLVQPVPVAAK